MEISDSDMAAIHDRWPITAGFIDRFQEGATDVDDAVELVMHALFPALVQVIEQLEERTLDA